MVKRLIACGLVMAVLAVAADRLMPKEYIQAQPTPVPTVTLTVVAYDLVPEPFDDVRRVSTVDLSDSCRQVGIDYDLFIDLAATHHINSTYALAVMILETGWGSSDLWVNYNNPAGIKCGGQYCHYKTQQAGLGEMFALLEVYAYDLDLVTVGDQRSQWSESEDASKIINIMEKLEEK